MHLVVSNHLVRSYFITVSGTQLTAIVDPESGSQTEDESKNSKFINQFQIRLFGFQTLEVEYF